MLTRDRDIITGMRPRVRSIVLAVALACAVWAMPARALQSAGGRLVAIGDIHGAGDSFVEILRAAGLIDERDRWSGGRARLVQTGDFLDRGPAVRDVMELMMRLEDEARRAGGRVDVLFGNHEGMNVLHDLRDVSRAAYASFADQASESKRERAFLAHAAIARRAGRVSNRDEWMREHPPGFVEYVEAIGPSGRFGRWIRSRKVALKVDDSIFMHAGLPLDSTASIDDVNRTAAREVRAFDDTLAMLQRAGLVTPFAGIQEIVDAAAAEINRIAILIRDKQELPLEVTQTYVERLQHLVALKDWSLIAQEGPLWFRGYATLGDEAAPAVQALLKRHGAARLVIGHNPLRSGRITPRFERQVFLIDTGMLSSFYKGGRPSALEIEGGRITAIYTGEREPLSPASGGEAQRVEPSPRR